MHTFPDYDAAGNATGPGLSIEWLTGPLTEATRDDGATVEMVIRALIHRVEQLDTTLPCTHNKSICDHLQVCLHLLDLRTRERHDRGVLGTDQP